MQAEKIINATGSYCGGLVVVTNLGNAYRLETTLINNKIAGDNWVKLPELPKVESSK